MGLQATHAPTLEQIEALAMAALEKLPAEFRVHLQDVVVQVDDFADAATLDEMGIEDAFELTGLYRGRPIGDKFSSESGALPDMIHLYRRPILDEWAETGVSLEALVTHVIVHEAGHHFGLSDADMHALEESAG